MIDNKSETKSSMELKGSFLLVAAIDFGTTYSGYAYSTRHDFETDPLTINLMTWSAGSGGLTSQKTSTCVLFKPDKTFHSFGYAAEDFYNELVLDDDHRGWYFFRRFKMDLYKNQADDMWHVTWWNEGLSSLLQSTTLTISKGSIGFENLLNNKICKGDDIWQGKAGMKGYQINRAQILKSSDGKVMSAITVISAVIAYLKGHLIETIKDRAVDVPESEIRWVVTVPAIWTNPAKQMMREAAEKAGIAKNQLVLALEPETASMLCKHLPAAHLLSGDRTDKVETFRSGSKYMVFDAGGGTIDITVHEVLEGGFLKEIHAANGGDWGGTKVDEALEELLESIVGKAAFEHFKANEIPSVIDLHRNFEVKKKTFTGEDIGMKTSFTVPCSLLESFKEYNPGKYIGDAIEMNHCSTDVEWKRDKVRLSQKKTLSLFDQSFKHITDHMSDILRKPEVKNCEAILMVGGYSECPPLQDAIRTIAGDLRLIVPSDASLAVLKGAVINGHCPDIVSERICKYTYGTDSRKHFIEGIHREDYRIIGERGDIWCENSFTSLVKKGTHIKIGTSSFTGMFCVATSSQTGMCFGLYASTSVDPLYITEASCQKIGTLSLDTLDTTLGLDRGASVTIYFGGSEIELKAVDNDTGNEIRACFDFLG